MRCRECLWLGSLGRSSTSPPPPRHGSGRWLCWLPVGLEGSDPPPPPRTAQLSQPAGGIAAAATGALGVRGDKSEISLTSPLLLSKIFHQTLNSFGHLFSGERLGDPGI
ncbi:unnamed protein product [Caretta caretta]